MNNHIVIDEKVKPFWQTIIAALAFTLALAVIVFSIFYLKWDEKNSVNSGKTFSVSIYLIGLGVGLSLHKRIYIDLKKSRFKSTNEVGPIKIGSWVTINNYEYVSIFTQPLSDGGFSFKVNLWYDKNKHFTLYEKNDFESALEVAYFLSEKLNIDLLDATIPNDFKWIDKETLKNN